MDFLTTTHNLGLVPELRLRTQVLGKDHRLFYDGPIGPFLGDTDKLAATNLTHAHQDWNGVSFAATCRFKAAIDNKPIG